MSKRFVSIPGWGDRYKVSDAGVVVGPRGPVGSPDRYGYILVTLSFEGLSRTFRRARLVAAAFLGEAEGREVDHINGSRSDDRPANLRYCTHAENIRFAQAAGRGARGERHYRAKLSDKDVADIRARYALDGGKRSGPNSIAAIAKDYGCHRACIGDIVRGRRRGGLDEASVRPTKGLAA